MEKNVIAHSCMSNDIQYSFLVCVQVQGRFLIEAGLAEEWQKRRGLSEPITPDFVDHITLLQAQSLGLLSWIS